MIPGDPGGWLPNGSLTGDALREHCERATGQTFDHRSPFGWTAPEHQRAVAERLLLRAPPALPSGRREFLVCAEYGEDLGCGCISANVRAENGYCVWSDFGYENDYDPDGLKLFPTGTFVFPQAEVAEILGRIVPGLARTTCWVSLANGDADGLVFDYSAIGEYAWL